MPRPGPPRPIVAVRLSDGGLKHIDALAKTEGVTRSEMMRIMLKYASATMPKGWR
jgi:Ribbon-helix-helix protein, copG family